MCPMHLSDMAMVRSGSLGQRADAGLPLWELQSITAQACSPSHSLYLVGQSTVPSLHVAPQAQQHL